MNRPGFSFPLLGWNTGFFIGGTMEKRLGFVGIILEDRKASASAVNKILSESGETIVARMGLPHVRDTHAVITLIVDATTDELGAMTGKLGAVPGVSVKSACAKI